MPQVTPHSSAFRPAHRFSASLASICAAVLAVIGVYAIAGSHASTSQLYLSPSNTSVLNGQNVTVVVYANAGSVPVNAAQANLSYNPSQLQYVGYSNAGSLLPLDAQSASGTPNTGSLQFVRSTQGGGGAPSGTFIVLSVTFKAVAGSGTAAVTFGSGSALYAASDSSNIVTSTGSSTIGLTSPAVPTPTPTPAATPAPAATPTPVSGKTTTPTPASPKTGATASAPNPAVVAAAGTAALYLSPASGSVANGTKLTVGIRMKTASLVNSVQANLTYQTSGLTFDSISGDGSAFPLSAQGNGGNGTVTVVRATNGGGAPVTGDVLMANITFIATANSGTATIKFGAGSVVLTAADSKNILANPVGGTYSLISGSNSTSGAVTASHFDGTTITLPTTGTGTPVAVSGTVNLQPNGVASGETETYQIDGHSIGSTKINTTYLTNGTHIVTAITTKADGSKATITQPLSVNNALTSWQMSRNTVVAAFGGNSSVALGTVVTLSLLLAAAVAFLVLRPHLEASQIQSQFVHHEAATGPTGFGVPNVVMPAGSEPASPLVDVKVSAEPKPTEPQVVEPSPEAPVTIQPAVETPSAAEPSTDTTELPAPVKTSDPIEESNVKTDETKPADSAEVKSETEADATSGKPAGETVPSTSDDMAPAADEAAPVTETKPDSSDGSTPITINKPKV
ncbi:hypothetical protein HJC99_04530 [Candidatus Saccharibacteria bacterium]|nr:hypothetical protein [Candidatus Saccharibacteria bacterium]